MRDHAEICMDLASQYRELAQLESAMVTARTSAWENSQETTVSGRDAYVRAAVAELEADVVLLKGDIRAVEYELRAVEWQRGTRG